jgi:poly-beta-hydroxyalkanoate depolymerase
MSGHFATLLRGTVHGAGAIRSVSVTDVLVDKGKGERAEPMPRRLMEGQRFLGIMPAVTDDCGPSNPPSASPP